MALSAEFRTHLQDIFSTLGPIDIRRMFGGAGLYVGDACFALVVSETVMMRADATLGPDYEAAGGTQWVYESARRGAVAMPYWSLPESALDDPEEAADWARRSLVPAEAAAAKKRAAKERKKTKS